MDRSCDNHVGDPRNCDCHRINTRERRRSATYAGIAAAVLATSYFYAPYVDRGPPICPFKLMFGIPCPGCGLTHSFCALAHGHLAAAVQFHALGPVLFVVFALALPIFAYQAITRRRVTWFNRLLFAERPAYIFATVLFLYHFTRLIVLGHSGALVAGMEHSVVGHGWDAMRSLLACV
jgi:Protein of unknown function (DUF2752)